jgi:hypothetical protein
MLGAAASATEKSITTVKAITATIDEIAFIRSPPSLNNPPPLAKSADRRMLRTIAAVRNRHPQGHSVVKS